MENTSKKSNVIKKLFGNIKKRPRRDHRYETPDPKSTVIQTGLRTSLPLATQVRQLVQQEVSRKAMMEGKETWQESDDFDVQEDGFPSSPHEMLVDDIGHQSIGDFIEETPVPGSSGEPTPGDPPPGDPPPGDPPPGGPPTPGDEG